MMKYNERGQEVPDQTPIEVPLAFKRPPSIQEMIQKLVRTELSKRAAEEGMETFEEADDFVVDDEPEPLSGYQVALMQEETAFQDVKNKYVDSQKKEVHSDDVDKQSTLTKEPKHGDDKRIEVERKSVGADGKERAASGGEGRSA